MPLLQTKGLTKRFGSFAAVDSVDYHVNEGEIASIIGPNGAGKTTFFNLITGEYEASEGTITFGGSDVTDLEPYERVQRGIGRVFQISNVFPELTTFENVRLAVQSRETDGQRGIMQKVTDDQEIIDETHDILEELKLHENRQTVAANLSYGNKRRLEIGRASCRERVFSSV